MNTGIRKWIRRAACGLALAGMMGTAAFAAPGYEVRLLEGAWTPPAGVSAAEVRGLTERANAARQSGQTTVHALVQLYRMPDESERSELARAGLDLGTPLPGNAWIAAIPVDQVEAVAGRPEVRWIEPWTAARKLHPRLRAGRVAPWARDDRHPGYVMAMVLLHHDVDLARGERLAEAAGGVAMPPIEDLHGLTIWLPEGNLGTLAAEEEVLWIEQGPPPLSENNDGARGQLRINSVAASPYDLTGKGVKLFVFDGGLVRGYLDAFTTPSGSRVTELDFDTYSEHATHVAGTAGGSGSLFEGNRDLGVAPGVHILSAGYEPVEGPKIFLEHAADIQADYAAARSHGADLANTSLGSNTADQGWDCDLEGDYGVSSALVDGIVRGDDTEVKGPMIVSWSNGNERIGVQGRCGANYHTTPEPSCAKNPIHVGAVHSDGGAMTDFSSWGPCDDGRLKPVVSAPGCETGRVTSEEGILSTTVLGPIPFCGTSMAAPGLTGTLALLIEDWRRHGHGGLLSSSKPRPALVKAMTVHTARDLGEDGPDYRFGYGLVDAKALIDLQRAGNGKLGGDGPSVWGNGSVATGETDSFTLTVPAGIGELKATLAWDDPAAAPFAALALVNDLDLELMAPDGTVHLPWVLDPANPHLPAAHGVNTVDNQEQVLVKNPQPGMWTVRVRGTGVPTGLQPYGLVYTAAARQRDERQCGVTTSTFESPVGNDGWNLNGAVRAESPAPGNGAFSLRLGGVNHLTHEARKLVLLPAGQSAEWSFDLFVTTEEGVKFWGYDELYAEVHDTEGEVLAVLSFHNDGEFPGTWLPQRNLDLTPWAGKGVWLVFRATSNHVRPTTFWIDDVKVTTCPAASTVQRASFSSIAAQDGFVREVNETTETGGTAFPSNPATPGSGVPAQLWVGDAAAGNQFKGFLSFDTSSLPDTATILSARLRLHRSDTFGGNPFDTHGVCRVDVKTGAFNDNVTLEPADFQAAATVKKVGVLSNAPADGDWSFATLNGAALAAINKTGVTQFRIAFDLGDDNDGLLDVIGYSPGEEETPRLRPLLELTYLQ